ncbi:MAG: PLDc N-terminal domain-containing protein [Gramella sp.]|nr:PLDc N-terminal domain-containing protein [Christiangramia sp.]
MIQFIIRNIAVISFLFFLLWGASLFAHILNLGETESEILIWASKSILFIFWLYILVDMIRNEIRDKTFWILSMFFLPFFAVIVYIYRRKNLIHLSDNKFKNARRFR